MSFYYLLISDLTLILISDAIPAVSLAPMHQDNTHTHPQPAGEGCVVGVFFFNLQVHAATRTIQGAPETSTQAKVSV